jgi:curli biogenesis system outer membrane secretion channel CsgG
MKRLTLLTILASLTISGCMSTGTQTTTREADSGVRSTHKDDNGNLVTTVKTLKCDAPVAKVSIAPLSCQASRCKSLPEATGNLAVFVRLASNELGPDFSNLGATMSTMLASSLAQTGCFEMLDRDALAALKQEMELAGEVFKPQRADLLVTGAVTSLEYETVEKGLGGLGLSMGGMFSSKETTAKLGVDMRLINVNSSAVEYTKTYLSDASNDQYSFGLAGYGGSGVGGAKASFGGNIEIEEAVRTVLNQTVFDIVLHNAKGAYKEDIVYLNNK